MNQELIAKKEKRGKNPKAEREKSEWCGRRFLSKKQNEAEHHLSKTTAKTYKEHSAQQEKWVSKETLYNILWLSTAKQSGDI